MELSLGYIIIFVAYFVKVFLKQSGIVNVVFSKSTTVQHEDALCLAGSYALAADKAINGELADAVLSMLRGEPARPEPTTGGDEVLPVAEVARRLHKTAKTVHLLARRGAFQKVAFPGQTRASGILRSSVEKYLVPTAKAAQ